MSDDMAERHDHEPGESIESDSARRDERVVRSAFAAALVTPVDDEIRASLLAGAMAAFDASAVAGADDDVSEVDELASRREMRSRWIPAAAAAAVLLLIPAGLWVLTSNSRTVSVADTAASALTDTTLVPSRSVAEDSLTAAAGAADAPGPTSTAAGLESSVAGASATPNESDSSQSVPPRSAPSSAKRLTDLGTFADLDQLAAALDLNAFDTAPLAIPPPLPPSCGTRADVSPAQQLATAVVDGRLVIVATAVGGGRPLVIDATTCSILGW